jgi:peptide/nickel transport system ATP-binding protein
MARLRGNAMAMIFQEPMTSLNPAYTIGSQMTEVMRRHKKVSQRVAIDRAADLLGQVGITAPGLRLGQFPHQLSGGLRQRVMIAMALMCEPQLLIADEPTAGLDITTQVQILDLLHLELRRRRIGGIIITRDLGVVAQYCDDIAVMYAGQVVEQGPVGQVFARPAHPLTRTMIADAPERLALTGRRVGGPVAEPADGCAYRARCADATDRCLVAPPLVGAGVHAARCHFARIAAA